MKRLVAVGILVVVVFSSSAWARPVFVHRGYRHPGFARHVYVARHVPHYYYGYRHHVSFGFAVGRYYAPAPVYVAAPPAVYYAPPPVVVQPAPVVVQPAPEVAPPPPPEPSGFVETGRRYHRHGSNEGRLDYVEGLLGGRPVRIYYDDFGRVKKQKWID